MAPEEVLRQALESVKANVGKAAGIGETAMLAKFELFAVGS